MLKITEVSYFRNFSAHANIVYQAFSFASRPPEHLGTRLIQSQCLPNLYVDALYQLLYKLLLGCLLLLYVPMQTGLVVYDGGARIFPILFLEKLKRSSLYLEAIQAITRRMIFLMEGIFDSIRDMDFAIYQWQCLPPTCNVNRRDFRWRPLPIIAMPMVAYAQNFSDVWAIPKVKVSRDSY